MSAQYEKYFCVFCEKDLKNSMAYEEHALQFHTFPYSHCDKCGNKVANIDQHICVMKSTEKQ